MVAGRRLSGWKPDAVVDFNDENDDEAERAKLAELKREESEKRQQRSPYRGTPGGEKRRTALLDTYAECIKMCTENKVNEKNSWNLDLINHLDRVIDEPSADGEGEMTNFQRASCTLEAGIKIYSYRVDSVYTETFKLMGGLNRTSKRDGQADDQDVEADAPEDGADGPSVQKKEKTSKRVAASAGTAFLEANPAALSLKKLELAFDVDPLFHRTSAKFDEGGAKGLLLHNLPVQHGCALVFDSSDAERPAAATAAAPALPLRCISNLLPRACLELHISSEFSEQHEPAACDWALGGRAVSGLAPHSGDSDDEDAADEPAADGPDHFDDDAPFAPPDNDDEPFDEVPMDDRDELLQQAQQGDGEGRLAILSLDEMMSEREGELEQGDEQAAAEDVHQKAQQMLQVGQRWAGPAHWKFHAAPKARAAEGGGGGGGGGGGRAGKAKSAFVLDFRNRAEALQAVLAMPLEAKGTTLSEAALSKAIEADNTLPNDHHCSVDALSQLFHKPQLRVRRGWHVPRAAQPREGEPQLSSAADVADDGVGEEVPDFGDDWGGDSGAQEAAHDAAPLPSHELELLAQPSRVEKIEIGYAKVAKQVDISALKRGLWELLADGPSTADPATLRMASEASFQDVVARLPEKIPEQKLPDISIAYNFICLLHLANEKGLEITGQPDMADLHVSQP